MTPEAQPQPLSAEEKTKLRESVRLLGDDGHLQWTNNAMARLLATLGAARASEPVDGLRACSCGTDAAQDTLSALLSTPSPTTGEPTDD